MKNLKKTNDYAHRANLSAKVINRKRTFITTSLKMLTTLVAVLGICFQSYGQGSMDLTNTDLNLDANSDLAVDGSSVFNGNTSLNNNGTGYIKMDLDPYLGSPANRSVLIWDASNEHIFRLPFTPMTPGTTTGQSLFWNNSTLSWDYNNSFAFLPVSGIIDPSIPTVNTDLFQFSMGPGGPYQFPLVADGNISSNLGLPGTVGGFYTAAGTPDDYQWNILGARNNAAGGTGPFDYRLGLRTGWGQSSVEIGMTQPHTAIGGNPNLRQAVISWQDLTPSLGDPINAQNRLILGARTGAAFQELAQITGDGNGYFGIGPTDPMTAPTTNLQARLHLYDDRITGNQDVYAMWTTLTATSGGKIGFALGSNDFEIRQEGSGNMNFYNAGSLVATMNVQPSGNAWLGVGTTLPIGFSGATPGVSIQNDLEVNGDGFKTGASWNTSDASLKRDVNPLSAEWKKILKLDPYSYWFIQSDKYNLPDRRSFGFLAQDVEQIIPELTKQWGDILTVNYDGFIPFLVEGTRNQEERIVEHGKRITQLEQGQLPDKAEKRMQELEEENAGLKQENIEVKQRLQQLEQQMTAICNLPCLQDHIEGDGSSEGQNNRRFGVTEKPKLYQNNPNPFNHQTQIRYYLPEGSENNAKILIKTTEGQIIREYPVYNTGESTITIASGTLAPANYYYTLMIGDNLIDTKKMVIVE